MRFVFHTGRWSEEESFSAVRSYLAQKTAAWMDRSEGGYVPASTFGGESSGGRRDSQTRTLRIVQEGEDTEIEKVVIFFYFRMN